MHLTPPSPDILTEIESWVERTVATADAAGVSFGQIILDPGIGFGKTAVQNLEILRNLDRLARTGLPLLVGTSRKSFIGQIVDPSRRRKSLGNSRNRCGLYFLRSSYCPGPRCGCDA